MITSGSAATSSPRSADVARYLELCTLGDLLVRGASTIPERDALVLPGVRRSYRELAERATGGGQVADGDGGDPRRPGRSFHAERA